MNPLYYLKLKAHLVSFTMVETCLYLVVNLGLYSLQNNIIINVVLRKIPKKKTTFSQDNFGKAHSLSGSYFIRLFKGHENTKSRIRTILRTVNSCIQ